MKGKTIRSRVILLLLPAVIALAGCATPGFLTGSVSTAFYEEPQGRRTFVIFQPDSLSLRDKHISDLITQKLLEQGYVKASSSKEANTAVLFKYSVGQGTVEVSSSPDFVWGGQKVESTNRYPRFFQLIFVDLQKSQLPEHVEIIWQGELYSEGSTYDIMQLAEHFINILFENYGKTVKDKRFYKIAVF